MNKWRVVITDHIFPSIDIERVILEQAGATVDLYRPGRHGNLAEACREADAILTCYARISADMIGQLNRCKIIARYGIGVDNVDVDAATKKGIPVTNVPDYCIEEVADHALSLILALVRKTVWLNDSVRRGEWDYRSHRPIRRLQTMSVGIAGFGKIGRALAKRIRAIGMNLKVCDPYVDAPLIEAHGGRKVDFEDLIASCDVISLHMPLTSDTYHILDERTLRKTKPGAFVVNTSRGGLIDEQALLAALNAQLGGAALDVLENEEDVTKSPLYGHPKVILTPHVAFFSEQSVVEQQVKAATQVKKVLLGQEPDYVVNPAYRLASGTDRSSSGAAGR